MKKLWPRQVGEEKQVAVRKYVATRKICRDRKYVATSVATKQVVETSVATSSMSRPVSQPEGFVASRKPCRDQKALSQPETLRNPKKKKPKIDILT